MQEREAVNEEFLMIISRGAAGRGEAGSEREGKVAARSPDNVITSPSKLTSMLRLGKPAPLMCNQVIESLLPPACPSLLVEVEGQGGSDKTRQARMRWKVHRPRLGAITRLPHRRHESLNSDIPRRPRHRCLQR